MFYVETAVDSTETVFILFMKTMTKNHFLCLGILDLILWSTFDNNTNKKCLLMIPSCMHLLKPNIAYCFSFTVKAWTEKGKFYWEVGERNTDDTCPFCQLVSPKYFRGYTCVDYVEYVFLLKFVFSVTMDWTYNRMVSYYQVSVCTFKN